jgi:hypothetical protein
MHFKVLRTCLIEWSTRFCEMSFFGTLSILDPNTQRSKCDVQIQSVKCDAKIKNEKKKLCTLMTTSSITQITTR